MTAFTQAQLDEALNAHERFVNRAGGGMRLILRYTVLDGLDLAGRDLREVDLSACSLVGCDLRVARLDQAVLFGCDLSQADLTGAALVRADLRGTVLCGANLTGVDMTDADCRPGKVVQNSGDNTLNSGEGPATDATGAVLQRASLDRSTADNADFSDCALVDAKLSGAKLKNASFESGTLDGVDLSGSNLEGVELSGAVLKNVNLKGAVLKDAKTKGVIREPSKEAVARRPMLLERLSSHQLWRMTGGAQGAQADVRGENVTPFPGGNRFDAVLRQRDGSFRRIEGIELL